MIHFSLNGKTMQYKGDPDRALMNVLREDMGIISPKDGCAPQAACGCCVVGVDDKALLSCVTKMSKIEGMSVTTTEGLGEYRQNVFADSFVKEGGVQCGFCIPGHRHASQQPHLSQSRSQPRRHRKMPDTSPLSLYRL